MSSFKLSTVAFFVLSAALSGLSHPIDCSRTYKVKAGDICLSIAQRNGVSLSSIFAQNPSINQGCTNLQIGQVLCLSSGVSSSPSVGVPITSRVASSSFGIATESAVASSSLGIATGSGVASSSFGIATGSAASTSSFSVITGSAASTSLFTIATGSAASSSAFSVGSTGSAVFPSSSAISSQAPEPVTSSAVSSSGPFLVFTEVVTLTFTVPADGVATASPVTVSPSQASGSPTSVITVILSETNSVSSFVAETITATSSVFV
ncbi:hypothetical protein CPC08DRAFT_823609 [Agrocybe pediades]|nr:hypothetical protein CPC08DRAFT_823609 [Agrocybe pediades]